MKLSRPPERTSRAILPRMGAATGQLRAASTARGFRYGSPPQRNWLKTLHPRLPSFAGFQRIAIYHDEQASDVIVEIEHWRDGDDHRAMVAAVASEGGWDAMGALLVGEPETRYLHQDG